MSSKSLLSLTLFTVFSLSQPLLGGLTGFQRLRADVVLSGAVKAHRGDPEALFRDPVFMARVDQISGGKYGLPDVMKYLRHVSGFNDRQVKVALTAHLFRGVFLTAKGRTTFLAGLERRLGVPELQAPQEAASSAPQNQEASPPNVVEFAHRFGLLSRDEARLSHKLGSMVSFLTGEGYRP